MARVKITIAQTPVIISQDKDGKLVINEQPGASMNMLDPEYIELTDEAVSVQIIKIANELKEKQSTQQALFEQMVSDGSTHHVLKTVRVLGKVETDGQAEEEL